MSQIEWIKAIETGAIEWSAHALRIMFERDISREAVKHVSTEKKRGHLLFEGP